jgi:hypothetical protein
MSKMSGDGTKVMFISSTLGIVSEYVISTDTLTIRSVSSNYQADGDTVDDGESNYGFQYEFDGAEEHGIIRPSLTPSVFELRNPNQDIYGKVI